MSNLVDAFASAFFFRIFLPGLVLTGGLHPFLSTAGVVPLLHDIYGIDHGPILVIEIAVLGLLAYASTIPTYHIVQGLRLRWLTRPVRWLTQRNLDKKIADMRSVYGDAQYEDLNEAARDNLMKLFGYLNDFPLRERDGSEPHYAMPCPTRLGCIIDKYTTYPLTRYGLDAEQFWNQVRYIFPDKVRQELDGSEAVAQGMVMSAAASWLTLSLTIIGLVLSMIGRAAPPPEVLDLAPSATVLILLLAASTFGLLLFSALAREAHRDFGRQYQAAFDVHAKDLRKFVERADAPFPEACRTKATEFALWVHHLQVRTTATEADAADAPILHLGERNDAL